MSKSFTINNVALHYVHFNEPRFDEMRNKDVYSCVIKIPNTDENYNLLVAELEDARSYYAANKASDVAEVGHEPYIPNIDSMISADHQTIDLNINSVKPPVVYDAYGDVIDKPVFRRVKDAEVQLFVFCWVKPKLKTKWGLSIMLDSVCVHDDLKKDAQEQSNNIPKLTFKKRK